MGTVLWVHASLMTRSATLSEPGTCSTSSGLNRPYSTAARSEEHTSELQSHVNLVCRLLLEKKKKKHIEMTTTKTHTSSLHQLLLIRFLTYRLDTSSSTH